MGVLALLRQLLTALAPYKGYSVLILGGLLLEMGFNGAVPLGLKFLIDYAITPQDIQVLFAVLGVLAGGASSSQLLVSVVTISMPMSVLPFCVISGIACLATCSGCQ